MKTKIKQANWKSKGLFGDRKYYDIVTTVYWQGDDAFIDTDSKLLFQMVCENFFYRHKDVKLEITLNSSVGAMFPESHRLYVYNLIYKELTKQKIKNDILEIKDDEELFYRARLDAQMPEHQKRLLRIIEILEIDFKRESDRLSRVLFKSKKKKDFKLIDIKKSEAYR